MNRVVKTWAWPDKTVTRTWADTQFPRPDQQNQQYTINIYSATFEAQYLAVITSILSHGFAHLLSMRHHPAVPAYRNEGNRVLFPADCTDTISIMGQFTHPGNLFFRERDIEYLRMFFSMKQGDKIGDKVIKDVAV